MIPFGERQAAPQSLYTEQSSWLRWKKLTTTQLETRQKQKLYSKEKKSLAYVIDIMNMILHDIHAPNINGTKLKGDPISLPSIETHRDIAQRFNDLIPHIQHLESVYQCKLKALQALQEFILHKAFTGELTNPSTKEIAA